MNGITKTRTSKKADVIEFILPFMMLLAQYQFGPISAHIIALTAAAFIILQRNKWKVVVFSSYKPFLLFFSYVVLRDVIRGFLGSDSIQTQINRMAEYVVVYFLVFIVCSQGFDEDKLYKTWKVAGTIYSLGLLYHIIQLNVFGQAISPISIIPGYAIRGAESVAFTRPCSFFAEPASFATAMMPLIFLALKRKELRVAGAATIAVLASTSTVGIVLSIVLWMMFLFQRGIGKTAKIGMMIVAALVVIVFLSADIFGDSLSKLLEVVGGGSTFGIRVTSSFEVIKAEDIFELIFGTNYNELSSFISSHLSSFDADSYILLYWNAIRFAYVNTFGQLMFKYGGIGAILFFYPYIKLLRTKGYPAKPYIIMVLASAFGQSNLLNAAYFLNIIMILLYVVNLEQQRCELVDCIP